MFIVRSLIYYISYYIILYYASLEYWAFEVLVFLAGLMPDSQITTSLIAIWYGSHIFIFLLLK